MHSEAGAEGHVSAGHRTGSLEMYIVYIKVYTFVEEKYIHYYVKVL